MEKFKKVRNVFVLPDKHIFCMKTNLTLDSAYDGLHLSVMVVSPEKKLEAVIQISHGMCGCKERYIPFMNYMAEHGVACVACDHRGHGASVKSADDLGYMYSGGYTALVEDMKLVSDWTHRTFPDVPLVLLGHSMGSMAARLYAKKYDSSISGLIVCGSPGYTVLAPLGKFLTGLLCLFNDGRMRPTFIQEMTSARYNRRFSSEGRLAWVCSDPDVRKEMMENPLCNYSFTANGMHNLMSMMVETYSPGGWKVSNPDLPVAFLSGEDDACMLGETGLHRAAAQMYGAGYHNVTAALFSNMRHEILNEVDRKVVWDDVLDFIRDNCLIRSH